MIGMKLTDYFGNNTPTDFTGFERRIDESGKTNSYKNQNHNSFSGAIDKESNDWSDEKDSMAFEMTDFNPNTSTDEDWKDMGLSEKQIAIIDNFESKGGRIKTKEDFKKIYGITDDDYKRISPYIYVRSKIRNANYKQTDSTKKHYGIKDNSIIIELNNADTLSLTQIIGIGPSFAKRICSYRDKLGGYLYKEQLKEVYGFIVCVPSGWAIL